MRDLGHAPHSVRADLLHAWLRLYKERSELRIALDDDES
jgi:hypothetical protein